MSLTTLIAYKGEFGLEFRDILDLVRPKASQFETQGGLPAFSADYPILVPYRLKREDAAFVGIAFDYLARFIIAKYSKIPLDHSSFFFYNAFHYIHDPEKKKVIERIKEHFPLIDEFYRTSEISDKFVAHMFTLAKLEQVARQGYFDEVEDLDLILTKTSLAIVTDIKRLGMVFKKVFIDSNLVRPDSSIIYNPTYGTAVTKALRGIDADIFIDGVLIDLKSTKNFMYNMDDAYQITGYYLFYLIDKALKADTELSNENIERLAFYKARAGQIEYFDVQDFDKKLVYEAVCSLAALFKIRVSKKALLDVVANIY